MIEVAEKPVGREPGNPLACRVSDDGEKTLPPQGGWLKRGKTIGPGRPKEAIRDEMRDAYAKLALPKMREILADERASDELKAKVAADLARICIGTDDKVQMADREAFLRSLARATVRLKYSDSASAELLAVVAEELGIE